MAKYSEKAQEYVEEKRSVVEQELRLTTDDKKKIFATLYTNALPQNRNYPYDFFWDNCATRPRDVFEKVLGSRLEYKTDSTCGFAQHKTMHDMLRRYVHNRPWVDFGFDLIWASLARYLLLHATKHFCPIISPNFLAAPLSMASLLLLKQITYCNIICPLSMFL